MSDFERRSQALGFVREPTRIDRSRQIRTVDMQVLVLGLGRTGTSSMRTALIMLGYYDVYHITSCMHENKPDADLWAKAMKAKFENQGKLWTRSDFDRVLGHCQAVCDHPTSAFAPELIEAYPEAKVILSVRDSSAAWKKSVMQSIYPAYKLSGPPVGFLDTIKKTLLWMITPPLEGLEFMRLLMRHTMIPDFPEHGEQLYILHNAEVHAAAKSRGKEVLEFNVKQGWGPLCEFLGKPIPRDENGNELPFPRVNDSASSRLDSAEMVKTELMDYFWTRGIYRMAGYIAAGSAVYMAMKNRQFLLNYVNCGSANCP